MGELATGGNALLFLPYGQKWLNQRKLYHQAIAGECSVSFFRLGEEGKEWADEWLTCTGKAADTYRPIQELEAKRLCHDVSSGSLSPSHRRASWLTTPLFSNSS
jgi:hypothetical protein